MNKIFKDTFGSSEYIKPRRIYSHTLGMPLEGHDVLYCLGISSALHIERSRGGNIGRFESAFDDTQLTGTGNKAYLSITELYSNNAGLFYGSLQRLFKTLLYKLIPSLIGPGFIISVGLKRN